MTREEAHRILECMEIDLTWALQGTKEPMLDVLRQRLAAINVAQAVLRPVSREQVERMWKGEWIAVTESEITGFNPEFAGCDPIGGYKCSRCKAEAALDCNDEFVLGNFCPVCGAPMTDEAVEMVMERLEVLYEHNA